jgi:hypothetical protein
MLSVMMIFCVHPDPGNRDLAAGELYTEDFERVDPLALGSLGQNLLINPLTPDQFNLLCSAREAEIPVTIEVTGLTDEERDSVGLEAGE